MMCFSNPYNLRGGLLPFFLVRECAGYAFGRSFATAKEGQSMAAPAWQLCRYLVDFNQIKDLLLKASKGIGKLCVGIVPGNNAAPPRLPEG